MNDKHKAFNLYLADLVDKTNAAQARVEAEYKQLDAAIIMKDKNLTEQVRQKLMMLHEAYLDLYIQTHSENQRGF